MGDVILLALLAVFVVLVALFNRLVRDRNQVTTAWSDVDVQLQRRHDLIPRLVTIVGAYAAHEAGVLQRVSAERQRARAAHGPHARGEIEQELDRDLVQLVALAEDYPELKASDTFMTLHTQLVAVENDLQSARRFYNGSVRQYNNRVEQFPHLLVARAFAFRTAEFFAAGVDAYAPVTVDLT